jgi:hypothetical protein
MDDLLEPAYVAHYTIMMLLSHWYGHEVFACRQACSSQLDRMTSSTDLFQVSIH